MLLTISEAKKILLDGGIVAFPTETVYGLGAVATNEGAIQKVFQAKNRPSDNPLICHFYCPSQIKEYVSPISKTTELLLNYFTPGPISFLFNLPKNSPLTPATGGRNSVICRIPSHPTALELLYQTQLPIAAPSANTSGKMSATTAEMVEKDLGSKIDGIIDGGSATVGLESTIIDARSEDTVTVLRPGAIGVTELQAFLDDCYEKKLIDKKVIVKNGTTTETTPGTKYRHYSPVTPIFLIKKPTEISGRDNAALLLTQEKQNELKIYNTEPIFKKGNTYYIRLGSEKDLAGIAQNLYRNFYELDKLKVKKAYFLKTNWTNSSLAQAIQNRLNKVLLDPANGKIHKI